LRGEKSLAFNSQVVTDFDEDLIAGGPPTELAVAGKSIVTQNNRYNVFAGEMWVHPELPSVEAARFAEEEAARFEFPQV